MLLIITHGSTVLIRNSIFRVVHLGSPWTGGQRNVPTPSKRVIEPTAHCCNEIISDVFVREKKDGTHKMVLNLKNLNQHANKIHFKMDTLNTIIKLVDKNCFLAAIDLKDAYYSVPIAAP